MATQLEARPRLEPASRLRLSPCPLFAVTFSTFSRVVSLYNLNKGEALSLEAIQAAENPRESVGICASTPSQGHSVGLLPETR